jgi:predicted DNA binding CopG/RHH family protein
MNNDKLDPPREAWETAKYEDDPFGVGDVDVNDLEIVPNDFLPPPEVLARAKTVVKITLNLDNEIVEYFKDQAKKHKIPYQRLIKFVLDQYRMLQIANHSQKRSTK